MRGEILNAERLEQLAFSLAHSHVIQAKHAKAAPLLRQLDENALALLDAYRRTLAAVRVGKWISPAAEWLIDNFHIIQEQLSECREDLPPHYYRELPKLVGSGEPRVYALAVALITHSDGQLDVATLTPFIAAYQSVSQLTMGELWAIPIALRLALLENLARVAARVERARSERETAAELAAELIRLAVDGPAAVTLALDRRVSMRVAPSTTMFTTELLSRLRDQDPALAPVVQWLEQRILERGASVDATIRSEHQSLAANQASVGNAITSMRTITVTDWIAFFEALSAVDLALREDPSGFYSRMDFATRDRYRHVVEHLAKRTHGDEVVISRAAIALAQAAPVGEREAHVGFYLIDAGVPALERALRVTPSLSQRWHRLVLTHPTRFYLGAIALLTLLLEATLWRSGAVLFLLALIPASEVAITALHLVLTWIQPPQALPKLDFLKAIDADCRTAVVVPIMLGSLTMIEEALEALEVRWLANTDPALIFALLADFPDADVAVSEADGALLSAVTAGITALNARHANHFLFLHRRRVWNASEGVFMGWERKRGKLEEFNRLLAGASDTTFVESAALRDIRYVLTLDSDTRLPRDTASKLIGTLAHPLNRAVLGAERITHGYGVLQPRISTTLESQARSAFAQAYSGSQGVDPYTTAISDVYQDLFAEGSFVGKGLYDVRAFAAALKGRVPDNTLLSHDLFEGCFARSALVSDVELYDDTPSHYLVAAARRHRWIRGDWQLAPWLSRRVPRADGRTVPNTLSFIDQWKIFDNLRRSLVAPSLFAALVAGWIICPSAALWTALVALVVTFPATAQFINTTLRGPAAGKWSTLFVQLGRDSIARAAQALLQVVFLPHQAWLSGDAIWRVWFRRHISHKHLLEWTTAAQAEMQAAHTVAAHYREMLPALGLALGAAGVAGVSHHAALWSALPITALWCLAPLVAQRLSVTRVVPQEKLSSDARDFVRRIARKTWRFFETFIAAADHFLPPDNFQEDPAPVLAHRTSPTNMGLGLLSNFAAFDLGFIGIGEVTARSTQMLAAIEGLERFRGHFLNWYDTSTKAPLVPRYVSTVDSGNLAGHLFTLKQACLLICDQPAFNAEALSGLRDSALILGAEVEHLITVRHHAGESRLRVLGKMLGALSWPAVGSLTSYAAELTKLAHALREIHEQVDAITLERKDSGDLHYWANALRKQVAAHMADLALLAPLQAVDSTAWPSLRALAHDNGAASAMLTTLTALAARADALVLAMDFTFLYSTERRVFAIGFNVQDGRLDNSFYDLLASEARLGSFIAIAKGDVPNAHWYRLGRPLVRVGKDRALLSWTGTMFEYLMPTLIMRSYAHTLLAQTAHAVVEGQIAYGRLHDIPWGTSEAAYNARDLNLNYQYGPFGVPGLGIKRGLGDDLVVAPYATALALQVAPKAAAQNFTRLRAAGLEGIYGFYESIDYTKERVPEGERGAIVRAFMAHHQGMTLVAISEHLSSGAMRDRFHADPRVQATALLLQERIPSQVALAEITAPDAYVTRVTHDPLRAWQTFDPESTPQVHLLSNGAYSVMLTSAGGGYSRYRGVAVTRWHEDTTQPEQGPLCYLHDLASGQAWSTMRPNQGVHELNFAVGKAEFRCTQDGITSHTAIAVSPEDNAEIRVLTLTNDSDRVRELEVTTYAELVLAPAAADTAHRAFSNLFIETEMQAGALLATRRQRGDNEAPVWAVHIATPSASRPEYETDRARFIGRGRTLRTPAAIDRPLSNTAGAVLDPIFSLRQKVRLEPGASTTLAFTTAIAESREHALALVEKYDNPSAAQRAATLAWTNTQAELHYLDITHEEAQVFLALASHLIYAGPALRAHPATIASNVRDQSALWAYAISGDLPILVVRVLEDAHVDLVRHLLRAHEYWRRLGLAVDLVILNEYPASYLQDFHNHLLEVTRASRGAALIDKPGGIFVRRTDLMSAEDRTVLFGAARVVLSGGRGAIEEQMAARRSATPTAAAMRLKTVVPVLPHAVPAPNAQFWNGAGGFSHDGSEYVIALSADTATPAPWINVIANERFGCLVSESGSGYTWSENSRENRLTPWSNDPVCDPAGEAVYVRDESTGECWTPTPSPIRGDEPFRVRHGLGYTVFETERSGIAHTLTIFVPTHDTIKVSRLVLRNLSDKPRRLSVTSYTEWVLGVQREASAPFIVTERDALTGACLARNTYNGEFAKRVAFADMTPRFQSFTADRAEFLGRGRDVSAPLGLTREALSGNVGAAADPCAALQVRLELPAFGEREVVITLGQGTDLAEARSLIMRYRSSTAVTIALSEAQRVWHERTSVLTVKTPDPAFDLLANHWLFYQVLSCRLFARSAFYQSGGAFGFRDQLQDVAALVYAAPELARAQVLRAAARQFVEGDVQHWWHPPTGRGVRTRMSDDLLWLPYIVAHYCAVTADNAVLEEVVAFISARPLAQGEDDAYLVPTTSDVLGSLFEHCCRAIDRSLSVGAHGLPLMGSGDWNDGMNRVGREGRGESVWLAWFLYATLEAFLPLCANDAERSARYREHQAALKAALQAHAWDGEWYLRAFFDDGTPLGSAHNDECRIDAIAQSWSVISGAGDPERNARALASVERELTHDSLIQLLAPPFDRTAHDPGYIKGYLPGVRENGGQYTHAAVWVVLAHALRGDGDGAHRLLSMINPINHTRTSADVQRYKAEPYVLAGDVYSTAPHTGRGGWSWYTGAASWMYRTMLETMLGFHLRGEVLTLTPCIPSTWPEFSLSFRHKSTSYGIRVSNPHAKNGGVVRMTLDGVVVSALHLVDDGRIHAVEVELG